MDSIREECGVFGVWNADSNVGKYLRDGLFLLQHRGQESCGAVSLDDGEFYPVKGMGLVNEVLSGRAQRELRGRSGIGHVRYSTRGGSKEDGIQPFIDFDRKIAISHNGQIANSEELREEQLRLGSRFNSRSDTEVLLDRLSRAGGDNLEEKMREAFKGVSPSYALAILTDKALIAMRDLKGFRPLVIGKKDEIYFVSSERPALYRVDANYLFDVERGEIVIIDDNGLKRRNLFEDDLLGLPVAAQCIFENIYFSRPDNTIFDSDVPVCVHRKEFGKQLAREVNIEADIVFGVPDSGDDAALGYSLESGIPYEKALIRNHFVGRTFIEPEQRTREDKVLDKFGVVRYYTQDKSVIVIDDSLVRGTTMASIVQLLFGRGKAKEVHVAISSPPYMFPCRFGIDTEDKELLVANTRSIEEIRQMIGATSLTYLSKDGMLSIPYLKGEYCTYCFDGIDRSRSLR